LEFSGEINDSAGVNGSVMLGHRRWQTIDPFVVPEQGNNSPEQN